MTRLSCARSNAIAFVGVIALACVLPARSARAESKWVDRPYVASLFRFTGEAGYGVAFGNRLANLGIPDTTKSVDTGGAFYVGAALSLPIGLEVGVRTGFRLGDAGKSTRADEFGRMYDITTFGTGADAAANPEINLRSSLFGNKIVELGAEGRFIIPAATGTSFGQVSGLHLRVHAPTLLRAETAILFPTIFASGGTEWAIAMPVSVWFQIGDFYVGGLSGFRAYRYPLERTDVIAGVGAGYTFAGMFDVKAQLLTQRINDSDWSRAAGFGLGASIVAP